MKRYVFSLLFLCAAVVAMAQYTVSGVLKDSLSSQPEAYATVRMMAANVVQPVAIGITDSTGFFSLKVAKAGHFQLVCSSIGRRPVTRSVTLGQQKQVDLGTLLMSDDANVLQTATVTATRPLVKAEVDKLSYSMAEDPDAQTNSLLEMLRKVPMVTVDGEDNIKVNGSSSFKVYVDGKPNQMMSANPSLIFKNYPASAIKKVEVITNPGARYDAEGVAGVLNIVTNVETSMSGYTLTPSLRVNDRMQMAMLFGMAQIGKLTLSVNYGVGQYQHHRSSWVAEREVFNDPVNHLLATDGNDRGRGTYQFGSLDGSYEFSKHDLISFTAGINGYAAHGDQHSDNMMDNLAGNRVYSYHHHQHQHQSLPGVNASVDWQHTFAEERMLTFSYRLNTSRMHSRYTNSYYDLTNLPYALSDLKYDTRNRTPEHTGQIDFTTPLGKNHKLSTGVKYIYRLNRSDNDQFRRIAETEDAFELDDIASLRYRQQGDIAAAYAEYNYRYKRFSAMAGTRYEYYHIHVSYPDGKRPDYKTDLSDLVPSMSLGYNLSDTRMLRLGYNMRIARPDVSMLSPYVTPSTIEAVSYGNPNMKSSKAHNMEIGFNTFSPKFSLNSTLTYSLSNNGITGYSFIDDAGRHVSTFDNFLHSKSLSLGTFLNWTIIKGTSVNLNGGVAYSDVKVHRMGDHNHGYNAYCWGGLTQQLPWRLKAELWMGGNTREVQLQGKGPSFLMYMLNLSRSFLKEDRLKVSVNAGNFLNRYRHFRNETMTAQFRQSSDNRIDFLRIGFGVSYRLGSLKAQVKKAARSIENNDVQSAPSGNSEQQGQGGGGQM
jgi:outer membrane receptor protein involved in Fe transport